jgi:AraC-like DNA-binding protein
MSRGLPPRGYQRDIHDFGSGCLAIRPPGSRLAELGRSELGRSELGRSELACETGPVDWTPGYRELPPPAWLRSALSCFWVGVTSPARCERTLVLPDACTDLIWSRGEAAFLAGPDTGPAPVLQAAGSVLVGARFRPGAGGGILGLPLAEVANQRVDVAQIPALRARMPRPDLPPRLVLPALAALIAELVRDRPADIATTHAARLLSRPGSGAQEVADSMGLSERQLRRRCQAGVGYGPRTLQRILRFRRFVSAIDAGPPAGGLAAAAIAAGYADQSHLSRECAQLSGLTPGALAQVRRPGAERQRPSEAEPGTRGPAPAGSSVVRAGSRGFRRPCGSTG